MTDKFDVIAARVSARKERYGPLVREYCRKMNFDPSKREMELRAKERPLDMYDFDLEYAADWNDHIEDDYFFARFSRLFGTPTGFGDIYKDDCVETFGQKVWDFISRNGRWIERRLRCSRQGLPCDIYQVRVVQGNKVFRRCVKVKKYSDKIKYWNDVYQHHEASLLDFAPRLFQTFMLDRVGILEMDFFDGFLSEMYETPVQHTASTLRGHQLNEISLSKFQHDAQRFLKYMTTSNLIHGSMSIDNVVYKVHPVKTSHVSSPERVKLVTSIRFLFLEFENTISVRDSNDRSDLLCLGKSIYTSREEDWNEYLIEKLLHWSSSLLYDHGIIDDTMENISLWTPSGADDAPELLTKLCNDEQQELRIAQKAYFSDASIQNEIKECYNAIGKVLTERQGR
jgi:hypothetical protein